MSNNGEALTKRFSVDLAPRIRVLLAEYGYQPLWLTAVHVDGTVWNGVNPDIAQRPQYLELVRQEIGDLVHELSMMAFLDGLD